MLMDLIAKGATTLLGGLFNIVDQVVEDKDKAAEIKAGLQAKVLAFQSELLAASTQIITTEATGGWLQRNWRPLTMLTFVVLVVSRWMGFAAPGMTEAEYLSVYDLIKIGLGGYVAGRTVEKIAPGVIDAIKVLKK